MNSILNTYKTDKKLFFMLVFVPVLFSLLFFHQVYLVFAYDLSVWKGGGMGMFSSPDHPSKRHLRYYVTDETGTEYEVIPNFPTASDLYGNFATYPHPKYLQDIQESFMMSRWFVINQEGNSLWVSTIQECPEQTSISPSSVRIEFWKMTHINAVNDTYNYEPVNEWDTKYEE